MAYAEFRTREVCIACGASRLHRTAAGTFGAEPLRTFIAGDPWGISPLPYVEHAPWEFVRCGACGQRFHRYVLTPEWDARRFDEWMGPAVSEFGRRSGSSDQLAVIRAGQSSVAHVLRLEALTRTIRGGAQVRFLDFGCGRGLLPATAALFGFEAWGLDRDSHRRRDALSGFRLCADLAEVDGQFHAIALIEVLEHLVAPMEVLRALHAMLIDGGVLVVETPNCETVRGISSIADYRAIHPLDHLNAFEPATLRRFVERAGFRVINAPVAYVASESARIMKTAGKAVLARLRPTTQLYCRRR